MCSGLGVRSRAENSFIRRTMPIRRATSLAERGEIAAHRQAALLRMVATDPLVRRGLRHVVAMTGAIPGLRDVVPERMPKSERKRSSKASGRGSPRAAPATKEHSITGCVPSDTPVSSSSAAPPSRAQRRLARVLKHKAALAAAASFPVGTPAGGATPVDAALATPRAAKRPAGESPSWAAVASARPPPVKAADRPNIGDPMANH